MLSPVELVEGTEELVAETSGAVDSNRSKSVLVEVDESVVVTVDIGIDEFESDTAVDVDVIDKVGVDVDFNTDVGGLVGSAFVVVESVMVLPRYKYKI